MPAPAGRVHAVVTSAARTCRWVDGEPAGGRGSATPGSARPALLDAQLVVGVAEHAQRLAADHRGLEGRRPAGGAARLTSRPRVRSVRSAAAAGTPNSGSRTRSTRARRRPRAAARPARATSSAASSATTASAPEPHGPLPGLRRAGAATTRPAPAARASWTAGLADHPAGPEHEHLLTGGEPPRQVSAIQAATADSPSAGPSTGSVSGGQRHDVAFGPAATLAHAAVAGGHPGGGGEPDRVPVGIELPRSTVPTPCTRARTARSGAPK